MAVTIAEIARRAGVSKTTVSRVLNGKPDVDERTVELIDRIVTETGYIRNARAVGLARGRTGTIGVLVPSLRWPWMAELLEGVVETVEEAGHGLLLSTAARGTEPLAQFSRQVSSSVFDGLLVIVPPDALDYVTGLHRNGLPVVLIDDRGQRPDLPTVATTNRTGGEQAAGHLLEIGRGRPAMITGPAGFGAVRERSAGFLAVYASAASNLSGESGGSGVLDPRLIVSSDFTEEGGYASTGRLLATGLPFDGLFAHNDLMAAGALRALRGADLRVPGHVAVIGFDDIPLAAHTDPPLTTVRQPCREMGAAAARILLDHLAGRALPDLPVVLPTAVVLRRSTPVPCPVSRPAGIAAATENGEPR